MTVLMEPKITGAAHPNADLQRLVRVAVNGLPQMFDTEKQLFCYSLKQSKNGFVRTGISHRYTVITLMGLHRLEQSGQRSPIKIRPVLDALFANTSWLNNIGDLGLLLWLCALVAPERVSEIESKFDLGSALGRYQDAKQARTMELAWFLTGLCHWSLSMPDVQLRIQPLAFETFRLLCRNQGTRGAFAHMATDKSLSGRIRGHIGSFADQVYPIYAMSKFFQAYGEDGAAKRAISCAQLICEAQGPLGQWWWHYDSATGTVAEGYPVFSVHQHGMGPLTLFALHEATQSDFTANAYKGLEWLERRNELTVDMKDATESLYWRSIFHPAVPRYWNALTSPREKRTKVQVHDGLKVRLECRPYELGWLLYAFASHGSSND
jgi:hypothetical protein